MASPTRPRTRRARRCRQSGPSQAKWGEAADRLQNETSKLYAVSRSGDEAAVKAQIGAVGKACGGCHESFRQKQ
jgi:cytochrome c556